MEKENINTFNLPENGDIRVEGLGEKEVRELKPILQRLIKSYEEKAPEVSDKDWLTGEYLRELPELSSERAAEMAAETVDSIAEYDKNLSELNAACASGKSKEVWFADKMTESAAGVPVAQFGSYMEKIDNAISTANEQMLDTVMKKNSIDISQCPNLDGFIAEQYHVDTFNANAALNKSSMRAYRLDNRTKNSVDVVIRDTSKPNSPIVHRYQVKYGKDAQSTIKMLRESGTVTKYGNQQLIVPPDQVDAVKAAFPGKTVRSTIEAGGVEGVPLTKEAAKGLQLETQEEGLIPSTNWNTFTTRNMALQLGKNAASAGVQAALITTGISLAQAVFSDDGPEGDEIVKLALETGADAGVKAATAGAMKIGVEKGIISIIPKGTPAGIIANIACVGIENAKIAVKVFKGELTAGEGLDHMGRTTVSMFAGLAAMAEGASLGASALSWIPVVGPVVGGLAGGMIGYFVGSKAGDEVYSGAKKLWAGAKNFAKKAVEKGRNFVRNLSYMFS